MLLQAIVIDDRAYQVEKAGKSFINTYIFPGGCLPSLEMISRQLPRVTDLRQVHLEDITAHYATTLALLARALPRRLRAPRGARLRRALPPAVGALPLLLRGRLPRAADPGRAAAAREARLSRGAAALPAAASSRTSSCGLRSIGRPARGGRVSPMKRTLYEDVHEDFRASFRTFLEREVLGEEGRYGEWERDGIVPREVFALAGRGGFLGDGGARALRRRRRRGLPLQPVIGEETQRAGVGGFGLGITLHNDICLPYFLAYCDERPARALAAGDRLRRADHRAGDDRARDRLGPRRRCPRARGARASTTSSTAPRRSSPTASTPTS